jgi:hypothetical protein
LSRPQIPTDAWQFRILDQFFLRNRSISSRNHAPPVSFPSQRHHEQEQKMISRKSIVIVTAAVGVALASATSGFAQTSPASDALKRVEDRGKPKTKATGKVAPPATASAKKKKQLRNSLKRVEDRGTPPNSAAQTPPTAATGPVKKAPLRDALKRPEDRGKPKS